MGIKGLRTYINKYIAKRRMKGKDIFFCIDAKNVHYKLYRSNENNNCDLDEYRITCEKYISMFNKKNIKAIWFFPGPAPPKKLDTLIERQRSRFKDAIDAYISEDFEGGFLHQASVIEIFKSVLKKYNQEIIYTAGEIDDVIVTYANKNRAYIISEESDFVAQKNANGAISPYDIYRQKNDIKFFSVDYNTTMKALGFDNEQELYAMIYILGNMYEHLDEDIINNLKKKYNIIHEKDYLNIYDCIKIVKQLNDQEGEWSDRLIGDMVIDGDLKEKINQDKRYTVLLNDDEIERNILHNYIHNYVIDLIRYKQYMVPPAIPIEENKKFMEVSEIIIDFLASLLDVGDEYNYITDDIHIRRINKALLNNIEGFSHDEKEKYDESNINTMSLCLDKFKTLSDDIIFKLFYCGLEIDLTYADDKIDYYFYVCIKLLQRFCDNEIFINAVILLISSPSDVDLNEIIIGNKKCKLERKDKLEILKYQIDLQIILENVNTLFLLFNLESKYDMSLLMKITRKLLFSVVYSIQENELYCEKISAVKSSWFDDYQRIKSWLEVED